jgi:hypothetical protein
MPKNYSFLLSPLPPTKIISCQAHRSLSLSLSVQTKVSQFAVHPLTAHKRVVIVFMDGKSTNDFDLLKKLEGTEALSQKL